MTSTDRTSFNREAILYRKNLFDIENIPDTKKILIVK